MRKLLLGFVSLTLILLLIPFSIGLINQNYSQDLWQQIAKQEHISIQTTTSERGLFHQRLQTQVRVEQDEQAPLVFNIIQAFRYGPILWGLERPITWGFADASIDIQLPAKLQQHLATALGQTPLMHLISRISYGGAQHLSLTINSFSSTFKNQQINFKELNLDISCPTGWQQYQAQLDWQGLQLKQADRQINIAENHSSIHLKRQQKNWLIKLESLQKSIQTQYKQQQTSITNLHIDSTLHQDQQHRISTTQDVQFDVLNYQGQHYSQGNYQLNFQHLPQSLLYKLLDLYQQISLIPAEQRAQSMGNMAFSMLSLLPDLLAAEPDIKISQFHLKHASGDIQGQLNFSLIGLTGRDIFNFPKIKRHLQADIKMQIPQALASQKLQEQTWLQLDNKLLKTHINMKNGILTINKDTIALPF